MRINDIKAWPPGALMLYDNMIDGPTRHIGVGLVVSNDGKRYISVVWDCVSHTAFTTYEVDKLNTLVINKVRL